MPKCTAFKLNLLSRVRSWRTTAFYVKWGIRFIYDASPKRALFVFGMKGLEALLGPILVWLSALVIDVLLQDAGQFLSFGPVFWLVAAFVLLTLLVDMLNPIVEMNKKLLTAQVQRHIDVLLMKKANTFENIAPFDQQQFHTKIKVVQYNEYFITMWLEMIASTFGGIVQISAGVILIWTVLPFAPLLFVLLALPRLFVEAKLNNVTFEGRAEVQDMRRRAEYFMSVPLQHELANEVKLYHLTPYFKAKYKSMTQKLIDTLSRDQKWWTFHNIGWGVLESAVSGLALIMIVQGAIAGAIQAGGLLLFIGALFQMREGINELFSVFAIGARELVNVRNMAQFLDSELPMENGTLQLPNETTQGFELDQVRFSYQEENEVLNIEHLKIPSGKVTVLVGENGSGKSTLVRLLLRLYEPNSGTIRFNGEPLSSYEIQSLRSRASAVFQDFVRYEMDFRSNIGIGRLDRMEDEAMIRSSAALGGADELAARLSDGYETEVGRYFGGIQLSGGEWQRIAMSRAFMRDDSAEILVFDEPTSALDPFMEHEIFNRLKALGQGKTVIIISHRLSTARMADYVVLLEQGQVLEEGTHQSLLERGGTYAELYHMQASKYHDSNDMSMPVAAYRKPDHSFDEPIRSDSEAG